MADKLPPKLEKVCKDQQGSHVIGHALLQLHPLVSSYHSTLSATVSALPSHIHKLTASSVISFEPADEFFSNQLNQKKLTTNQKPL